MTSHSWLRKLFGRRALSPVSLIDSDRSRRGKGRTRLTLEALKDRLVPAVFNVV